MKKWVSNCSCRAKVHWMSTAKTFRCSFVRLCLQTLWTRRHPCKRCHAGSQTRASLLEQQYDCAPVRTHNALHCTNEMPSFGDDKGTDCECDVTCKRSMAEISYKWQTKCKFRSQTFQKLQILFVFFFFRNSMRLNMIKSQTNKLSRQQQTFFIPKGISLNTITSAENVVVIVSNQCLQISSWLKLITSLPTTLKIVNKRINAHYRPLAHVTAAVSAILGVKRRHPIGATSAPCVRTRASLSHQWGSLIWLPQFSRARPCARGLQRWSPEMHKQIQTAHYFELNTNAGSNCGCPWFVCGWTLNSVGIFFFTLGYPDPPKSNNVQ